MMMPTADVTNHNIFMHEKRGVLVLQRYAGLECCLAL